jgi:hypothetical protein
MDVSDLRSADRFFAFEPIPGSFGAAGISVVNLAEQGAQIEHAQPIRLGTRARFWFKRDDVTIGTQALVVWSHLSKRPNSEGKLLYRSGLRVEEDIDDFFIALRTLVDRGVFHRDIEALDRKRRRLEEKEQERWGKPVVKMIRQDQAVPPDQALLIQHARERLTANPDEALKWYNRAKFALMEDGSPVSTELISHREDVLAVWEYLERSVDIATIVRVFEKK